MHVIDNSSQGADGVKLLDIDGDGREDIVTGWEEGGVVRIYRHPGPAAVASPWPAETVGNAPDVEDAVFADLDGDGQMEVVAACEGDTKALRVFRSGEEGWTGADVPALAGVQWMWAWPQDIDGHHGIDLVVAGKNKGATLGWLQSPDDASDLAAWTWHPLTPMGWSMSIWFRDLDGDGDQDILYNDRRGKHAGVWWLERPDDVSVDWPRHAIWTDQAELLSFALGDIDGDGFEDLTLAVKDYRVLWLRRTGPAPEWEPITIPVDLEAGNTRAAEPGDIDGDGDLDIAVTTWNAKGLHGVFWLENDGTPLDGGWQAHAISGRERGIKFDHSFLRDLDDDGDLDLITCEEHEVNGGLGVIWYENPQVP